MREEKEEKKVWNKNWLAFKELSVEKRLHDVK